MCLAEAVDEGVDVKKLKPCRVFITSVIIYGQTL